MKLFRAATIPPVLTALAFFAGALLYTRMPELVASHWDASGAVNGYMSKFWGTFLLPIVMAGLTVLAHVLPKIDPRAANIENFRAQYDTFWAAIAGLLAYVYALSLAWNLGARFNFLLMIIPALAVLFFVIGNLLEHSKQNWFIGIRTPWTLSSEIVWNKTNKLAAKLFRIAAAVMILGAYLAPPKFQAPVIIVPIFAAALASMIYSYLEFRKLK